jgi:hypothetical protein
VKLCLFQAVIFKQAKDLVRLENFVLDQLLGDGFEFGTMVAQGLLGPLFKTANQRMYFLVNQTGGVFAVVRRLSNLAPQKRVLLLTMVSNGAKCLAHAPPVDHPPPLSWRFQTSHARERLQRQQTSRRIPTR